MFSSYLEVVFCLQTRTTSKKTGPFSSNHGEKKMISPVSFAKHGEEKLGGSFFDCCGCNHFWLDEVVNSFQMFPKLPKHYLITLDAICQNQKYPSNAI
jgi:hypothetical protein